MAKNSFIADITFNKCIICFPQTHVQMLLLKFLFSLVSSNSYHIRFPRHNMTNIFAVIESFFFTLLFLYLFGQMFLFYIHSPPCQNLVVERASWQVLFFSVGSLKGNILLCLLLMQDFVVLCIQIFSRFCDLCCLGFFSGQSGHL